MFRYYTNAISNASKSIAWGIFVLALILIGFGVLILALPELFAILAAVVFFIAGAGCAATALKIYLAQRHIDRITRDDESTGYRQNVRIHIEEKEEF
jgi:cobalamin biosynthesis protein CobD/CbiB